MHSERTGRFTGANRTDTGGTRLFHENSLPEGLSIAKNGTLSGTPSIVGTYNYTITVTDSSGRTSPHTFAHVIKEGAPAPAVILQKEIILTVGSLLATMDGQSYTLEVKPFIDAEASRTLVLLRFVSEALGAEVDWQAATRQVIIKDGDKTITLTIDSLNALVNGTPVTLDTAPVIVGNRTFVPLRFISETLGATVDYEASTGRIIITR